MSYQSRPDGYRKYTGRPERKRSPWIKWLLALGVVFLLVFAGTSVALNHHDALPPPGLLIPLIVGGVLSPFARSPWLTARGRARYDEFERAAYARATIIAYLIFIVFTLALFVYLAVATRTGWPVPHTLVQWLDWGIVLLMLGVSLPLLIAEWTVPMPEPEDQLL